MSDELLHDYIISVNSIVGDLLNIVELQNSQICFIMEFLSENYREENESLITLMCNYNKVLQSNINVGTEIYEYIKITNNEYSLVVFNNSFLDSIEYAQSCSVRNKDKVCIGNMNLILESNYSGEKLTSDDDYNDDEISMVRMERRFFPDEYELPDFGYDRLYLIFYIKLLVLLFIFETSREFYILVLIVFLCHIYGVLDGIIHRYIRWRARRNESETLEQMLRVLRERRIDRFVGHESTQQSTHNIVEERADGNLENERRPMASKSEAYPSHVETDAEARYREQIYRRYKDVHRQFRQPGIETGCRGIDMIDGTEIYIGYGEIESESVELNEEQYSLSKNFDSGSEYSNDVSLILESSTSEELDVFADEENHEKANSEYIGWMRYKGCIENVRNANSDSFYLNHSSSKVSRGFDVSESSEEFTSRNTELLRTSSGRCSNEHATYSTDAEKHLSGNEEVSNTVSNVGPPYLAKVFYQSVVMFVGTVFPWWVPDINYIS